MVIFNVDATEINLKLSNENKIFPPMLTFNNKTIFFIVINLSNQQPASKVGVTETLDIHESELTLPV